MKKFSWIRSDIDKGDGKCPFGLPIIEACHHAGDSITHMCPLESISKDKRGAVEKANKRVYIYYKTDNRCLYASDIMDDQKVVNCDFGDTGAGMKSPTFSGSPLYPQSFSGLGLSGLYAFPLGFYSDNDASRNLFLGLFSLVGYKVYELIKETSIKVLEKIVKY